METHKNNTSCFTSTARFRCLEDLQKESMDLCLLYCGWEACDPCHRFGPNKREAFLLHIIRDGKGTLKMNNKVYHLKKGDAFFIPPGVEAWYEADKEEPWNYMWVGCAGLKAEECVENAGFSMSRPVRVVECLDEIYSYIEGMLEAHQLSYEDDLKRNAFLRLVFSALIREYRNNFLGRNELSHIYAGDIYVRYAVEYITCNYGKKIRIDELADYIGVNRSYLTSSFKKSMGCSPQEFLIKTRLEKAKSMLKNTDKPINEVAAQVGYKDQLAFSKIFKQNQGISPKVYREMKDELIIGQVKGEYESTRPI